MFSTAVSAFRVVQRWARAAGCEIALLVTQPTTDGLQVVPAAEPSTLVLVSQRVADCAGILEDADVDAGVVCGFGKVPESLVEWTRHGIVNLHPALLPEYPGPNPRRALYDGASRLGYTLHRIVEQLDAGPVLAQAAFDVPDVLDPETLGSLWSAAMHEVLEAGMARALADDPGSPQPPGSGTVASPFTEAETELTWDLPVRTLEARSTALVMAGLQPRGMVEGSLRPIRRLRGVPAFSARAPGAVHASARRALVGVADGVVELDLGELPFS